MFNSDYITKQDIKEYNWNLPEILDYPYRILIVGGFGYWKANALFNLINHAPDIDGFIFIWKRSIMKQNINC